MNRMNLRNLLLAVAGASGILLACSASSDAEPFDLASTPPGEDGGAPQVGFDGGTLDDAGEAKPTCGNGKREGAESCDDGNAVSNDGCSAGCQLETAFEGDTCSGVSIPLVAQGATLLHGSAQGSTSAAYGQYASACGGGSGKDVVYTFTPTTSGKAKITLNADYAAIVSARATCEESSTEIGCGDISAPTGGTTQIEVPVFANTPAFVFVDGYGGTSGSFSLDIDISTAQCGNGVAELPEACDDGNTVDGDGCSATCTLEAGGLLTQCPGQPFSLSGQGNAPRKISFAGNTTTGEKTQGSQGCFYWAGKNVVYALKSDVDGEAKAHLTAGYGKANVHARSECGSNSFQYACWQREAPGDLDIVFAVKKDAWFYVFVDGDSNAAGPYALDVVVTPAACGNGGLDGNEQCDDGNLLDGDGCSATCTLETLAGAGSCPGHTLPLTPDGDARVATVSGKTTGSADSMPGCNASNSTYDEVHAFVPDFDGWAVAKLRANFNSLLSVRTYCGADAGAGDLVACSYRAQASKAPFGLDGLGNVPREEGFAVKAGTTYFLAVDNGLGSPSTGTYTADLRITPSVCGNGRVEGGETCDDGATDDGDGCSATCQLEPTGPRSTCTDAESVQLTETAQGSGLFRASVKSGTTNLLANANFFPNSTLYDDEACWAPGRNAFFAVTAPRAGVLRATAKSDAFDVVVGIRKGICAMYATAAACANASAKGGEESTTAAVTAGEVVWVVVDTKTDADFGRFTLDLTVSESTCGDGVFVPGTEQCDDGNTASGDGCSATCQLETLPGVDTCPGATLTLAAGSGGEQKGSITVATSTLNADYAGLCGGSAKDGVVRVVSPISGLLRAGVRGMPNATVYARAVCEDPGSEYKKTSGTTCPGVIHDRVEVSVAAGQEVFLFVDGLEGASGSPTLDVSVMP